MAAPATVDEVNPLLEVLARERGAAVPSGSDSSTYCRRRP